MPAAPNSSYSTHRIRLSEQEDLQLRERAAGAGMSITAFVKRAALSGPIKVLEFSSLSQHSLAIGEIAHDIHEAVASSHPDRWLYQADLERIEDKLNELIQIECSIQTQIRRRIK